MKVRLCGVISRSLFERVAFRKCVCVKMYLCENVFVWKCVCVKMCLCENVFVWKCVCVKMCLCGVISRSLFEKVVFRSCREKAIINECSFWFVHLSWTALYCCACWLRTKVSPCPLVHSALNNPSGLLHSHNHSALVTCFWTISVTMMTLSSPRCATAATLHVMAFHPFDQPIKDSMNFIPHVPYSSFIPHSNPQLSSHQNL